MIAAILVGAFFLALAVAGILGIGTTDSRDPAYGLRLRSYDLEVDPAQDAAATIDCAASPRSSADRAAAF